MRTPKRSSLRLLCCAVAVIALNGCGDDFVSGWGTVAIILDQSPWARDELPVLERAATVSGKVFEGEVTVFSSDPSVFEVTSTEEQMANSAPETLFTLLATNTGSAYLVIEPKDGSRATAKLPVQVSEGVSVEIVNPTTGENLDAIAVTRAFTFLESSVRDPEGVRLTTHVIWTLENTDAVVFANPANPEQFEGPFSALVATGEGTSTLRAETGAGLFVTVPVVATVQ